MKVGLLTAHASRRAAGVWVGVKYLGVALSQIGVEAEVFALADSWSRTDCADWAGPELKLHSVVGSAAFGYAPSLGAALDAGCLSILHASGIWMYPSLASLRWSRRGSGRRPYVVTPHGMLDPWAVRNAAWKKRLVGWWFEDAHLAGAACLHALADSEARAIRSFGLRNPICVIPSGVDPPEPAPRALPTWAAEAGGRRVLLFLGRLHAKKGLLNLVRAWAEVQADPAAGLADWVLVIAGWDQGGHEAQLRRLIDELGAAATVRVVGPQFGDDKAASLAFADAFVLPSLSEGLPIAVLEAWSFGLPVLMTDACNLPEGFAAGAALRTEPEPVRIAEALRHLMAMSEADRQAMGARGRDLVRDIRLARDRAADEIGLRVDPWWRAAAAVGADRLMRAQAPLLSVIILAHNEEHNLPACLASLGGLDAEVFVVDSGSSDRTLEIARDAGCQLVAHPFENYARQRNWAFDHLPIRTPWTLCLDADERLTPELAAEIGALVTQPEVPHDGYMLRKRTLFLGRWIRHGGQYPAWHLRLFRSGRGRCEDRLYDQHFIVRGSVGRLHNDYIDVITSDLGTFIARHNRWAELEAQQILAARGAAIPQPGIVAARLTGTAIERRRFLRIRVYQRFPLFLRPFLFWIYGYIFRLGFLDGIEGLIFHTLQRFWFRFLIDAKLWELTRKARIV